MHRLLRARSFVTILTFTVVALMVSLLLTDSLHAAEAFSATAVDLGIVVGDLEKSSKFYTEAIGMKANGGFSVPGPFAAKAGLSDAKELRIRNFVLGGGKGSTIKLMAFEGETKKAENEFIHSTLGFSYLTIHVTDMNAAMQRLKKAGVQPLKNSPIALPAPLPTNIFIALVRDPDGNFVELVGPVVSKK